MTASPEQQIPALDRRPEARGFRVEQLLDEARRGILRIPHFQRPLRWRTKNVLELFDSIRRGFPIGDLLLSRDTAPGGSVSFGPVNFQVNAQHAALWVVDGQQRLTALVAALLRKELAPKRDYWAVWYDLQKQTFQVLQRREPEPAWIPLNVLSDSVKQLKWIRNWPHAEEREDLVDRALELGKAVREYEVPAYIVDGANDEVLRLIFTRANTGGMEMRESEIFEALYGHEGEQPLRSAVARLVDLGFGSLDEDLFLRCLKAICHPIQGDHIGPETQLPENSIQRTEAAVRRAVTTITTWAEIPVFKLMPYRLPLYILSAFYDRFPAENSRADQLAARWIWRGALSGRHEDSSDAKVRSLVEEIRSGVDAEATMAGLIRTLGDVTVDSLAKNPIEKIDQKISLKSAASKIFILALLAAGPRRSDSPAALEQPTLFAAEEPDADSDSDESTSAEDTLHAKFYRSLLVGQQDTLGTDIVIRLDGMTASEPISADKYDQASFLLSEDAVQFALAGSVQEFRQCRRGILLDYLPRFIADRIGEAVDIRPSVRSLTNEPLVASATE